MKSAAAVAFVHVLILLPNSAVIALRAHMMQSRRMREVSPNVLKDLPIYYKIVSKHEFESGATAFCSELSQHSGSKRHCTHGNNFSQFGDRSIRGKMNQFIKRM